MSARPIDEPHRASSQLELFFDLTFVVAVARLTAELAHGVADGHAAEAIVPFLQVFFAVWWAWMNFTWFASSYDTDDVPYRLLTLLQMAGVLVLAAGVPAAANSGDFRAVTTGYVIMRVGLVALWVRAAREDPASGGTARRYAIGISIATVGWVVRLIVDEIGLLPGAAARPVFLALVVLELAIPPWAERTALTAWHPHHIAERYGLFVIILLGEGVLAASAGVAELVAANGLDASFVMIAVSGLMLVFTLWWLYFLEPFGDRLAVHRNRSYLWGYGHFGVFASLAAFGGGLEVAVVHPAGETAVPPLIVGYAIAIPVAGFLLMGWAVSGILPTGQPSRSAPIAMTIAAVLGIPLLGPVLGPASVVTGVALACSTLLAVSLRAT